LGVVEEGWGDVVGLWCFFCGGGGD